MPRAYIKLIKNKCITATTLIACINAVAKNKNTEPSVNASGFLAVNTIPIIGIHG